MKVLYVLIKIQILLGCWMEYQARKALGSQIFRNFVIYQVLVFLLMGALEYNKRC